MRVHKMATVREVLHQYTKKISSRAIAKSFGMSKTTVRKYLQIAIAHGYSTKINDEELQEIAIKVEMSLYQAGATDKAPVMSSLLKYQDLIKGWLGESNMTHTQIQRLLVQENIIVSRRSISRFIDMQFPKLPILSI